jgi:hypothetical protein
MLALCAAAVCAGLRQALLANGMVKQLVAVYLEVNSTL